MRNEIQDAGAIGGRGLKVAAYYRMSDDEQKLSIGQQQKEVRAFAASRGWVIVAEYIDSGKSGSKNIAARVEFHKLIADAKRGEWSAVLCYNSSRFGRLDSIDSAPYKSELRKHGIYLETVTEGRIDWRTSMGRIQDALLSEQNHKYSLDISDASTRGRHDIAERGLWSVGEIPFGYNRELVDDSGAVQMTLERSKQFSKPRNWHTRLAVNETEAAIVRDIFKRFASADMSIRQLVKELNSEETPSPGSAWSPQMLSRVLQDVAYIGTARVGFARKSKEAHKRIKQQERTNACPSIVDAELFEKVQSKIASRATAPGNASQFRSGALSGVLICGHCGYRMDKKERGGKVIYVCSSATKRPQLGCRQWSVREADILGIISEQLLAAVDAAFLARLHAKPSKKTDATLEAQRKAISKLEAQYERARKNLLLADADLFASLQRDTLALKGELDKARNTLAVAETEGATDALASLNEAWNKRKGLLVSLTMPRRLSEVPYIQPTDAADHNHIKPLAEADGNETVLVTHYAERTAVRDLLKALSATVTLHWTPTGERYFDLTTATIRAEVKGENVSVERSSTSNQNILIERTVRIERVNLDRWGRYRGRSPERPQAAYRAFAA